MDVLAGLLAAISIVLLGKVTRQADTVAFYCTVLTGIALVYVLFAVMTGTTSTIVAESAIAAVFVALSIGAARWDPPRAAALLIVAGLVAHGLYDLVHGAVVTNTAVPGWWPTFCGVVDVVLGGWVLTRRQKNSLMGQVPTP